MVSRHLQFGRDPNCHRMLGTAARGVDVGVIGIKPGTRLLLLSSAMVRFPMHYGPPLQSMTNQDIGTTLVMM